MELLSFIRAVRTWNWQLHLSSLEVFTKYFFAHDKINYARMIPVYLAEMTSLKDIDPRLYEQRLFPYCSRTSKTTNRGQIYGKAYSGA